MKKGNAILGISLALLLVIASSTISADGFSIEWAKVYDSGEDDLSQGIVVDSSGDIFVICASGIMLEDLRIIKYDSVGNEQWSREIPGYAPHHISVWGSSHKIALDSQDNLIIFAENSTGHKWLLSYNPDADTLTNLTELPDYTYGCSYFVVAVDPNDDSIILAGEAVVSLDKMTDYFIIKFSFTGNIWVEQWRQVYDFKVDNESYADGANGVVVANDGSVFVAGTSQKKTVPFIFHAVAMKLNATSGEREWIATIPIEYAKATDVDVDSAGNVFVPINSPNGSCIIKYNGDDGSMIWRTDFQPYILPPDYLAIAVEDGDIYVGGGGTIYGKFYVERFDANGNSLGNHSYSISEEDILYDIALGSSVVATGTSSGDVLTVKFGVEGFGFDRGGDTDENEGGGIPGFELAFLFIAIAIIFLLQCKRRNSNE